MLAAIAARFGVTPDELDDLVRLARLLDAGDWCLLSGAALVVVGFVLLLVGACLTS